MIDKAYESGAGTFRRREAQGKAASDNATRLFRPFSMLGGRFHRTAIGCGDMRGDIMKPPWRAVASVILALILSDSRQARSFNDPRSEKKRRHRQRSCE